MHAIVHGATNLRDADSYPLSGLSDPYVRLQVGSTVVSTSAADETLHPVRYYFGCLIFPQTMFLIFHVLARSESTIL